MSKTFDTLALARQLQAAGMERSHAEAVADVIRDGRKGLATEKGLDGLRRELTTHRWILVSNAAMTMAILTGIVVIALQS